MEITRNKVFSVLKYLFVFLVIFFIGKSLFQNWEEIKRYSFELNIYSFMISVLLMLLSVFVFGMLWNLMLVKLSGRKMGIYAASYIHFSSWLGRYIPGKVGIVLTKIIFGKKNGYKTKELVFASVYENVFIVLSSFLFGVPVVFSFFNVFSFSKPLFYILYIAVIIIGALLASHPSIFSRVINFFSKIGKYSYTSSDDILSAQEVIYYLFLYSFPRLLSGLGFFFLISSIIPLDFSFAWYAIGVYSLSSVVGYIAVFAPSGIGVREAMVIFLLSGFFPVGISVLISVLSRIWIVFSDLLILFLIFLYRCLCKVKK
jgi:hypothetical protein